MTELEGLLPEEDYDVVQSTRTVFYHTHHLYAVSWEPPFYNYTMQTGKG